MTTTYVEPWLRHTDVVAIRLKQCLRDICLFEVEAICLDDVRGTKVSFGRLVNDLFHELHHSPSFVWQHQGHLRTV